MRLAVASGDDGLHRQRANGQYAAITGRARQGAQAGPILALAVDRRAHY